MITLCAVLGLADLGIVASATADVLREPATIDVKAGAQARRPKLSDVKSWAIQLRFLDRIALADAPVDLVVIDHAPHPAKDVEVPFTREEIEPLKVQSGGERRIVLAYLSIGEAERYRY